MAPVIDTYPQYPRTYATTMSAPTSSTTAFTSLVLGRSANAIELLVPPAPAVHDATDLKARCFHFLADLLIEHSSLHSSAELIAAFAHIPNSSFNASLEAADICKTIRSAFFSAFPTMNPAPSLFSLLFSSNLSFSVRLPLPPLLLLLLSPSHGFRSRFSSRFWLVVFRLS
jgi:hypothetical protein